MNSGGYMGLFSVVLIAHDGLHEIENDQNFGKNLSRAICERRISNETSLSVSTRSHTSPARVIGRCFHISDLQIVVIEDGTGWIANGKEKPNWSSLTWNRVRDVFSEIIPKRNKKV